VIGLDRHLDEDRLVRDLCALVATASVNPFDAPPERGSREREIAAVYRARLEELGLEPMCEEVVPGRPNLWARLPGTGGGPTIMLAGHLDTVGVEGCEAPFAGDVRDGRVYGRGACDMKAGLAAFLEVLEILRAGGVRLRGDLIVAALCDEEHLMLGSRAFAVAADFAIVAEPTRLAVCRCHNGQLTYLIRTHGQAAHSSRPEHGRNAIVAMGRVIAALDAHADALREREPHPLAGTPRLSPGVIRGGTISSTVPDLCELEIDRRITPGETREDVVAELHAVIGPVAARAPAFEYDVVGPKLDVASLETPADAAIVGALATAHEHVLGRPAEIAAFPGGTDAPNLRGVAVVCGPGDAAQAHTVDEWVEIAQVVAAVRVYLHAIIQLDQARPA